MHTHIDVSMHIHIHTHTFTHEKTTEILWLLYLATVYETAENHLCPTQGYYYCDKTSGPKQLGEERVYLDYASVCSSLKEVRTGAGAEQEPTSGAEADAMEEYYLLACSSWLTQPAFL